MPVDSLQETNIVGLTSRFINNTRRHVFLTGKAGTGKTTFLRNIVRNTFKNAVIVAPTGIAAINAGGVTIHSMFQLPFGAFVPTQENFTALENTKLNTPRSLIKEQQLSGQKRKILRELELLIIDEVSMLRADLLDAIDTVLRSVRRKQHLPFGGVQVLFIGDLLQLPPVVKDDEWNILKNHYKSVYFFDAQVLRQDPPLYIELEKIYRQSDNTFIALLNNLRNNTVTPEDESLLNQYYKPEFTARPGDNYIQLTTHNYKADAINRQELQKLKGKSYFYRATTTGDFNEYAYPVEQALELKEGAQVMFVKNDPSGMQLFFNGKIGRIAKLSENTIEVLFEEENKTITVDHYQWENIKYKIDEATNEIEEEVTGTFTQYPIKLAWAITVHKSQGLTFEKAIIDIGKAFAPGQVYVALSRLTSLDGLVLSSKINFNSLAQDKTIAQYAETKENVGRLNQLLEKESKVFFEDYIARCFDFSEPEKALHWHVESYSKDEKKSAKQKYREWALELKTDFESIKEVADKFLTQVKQIIASANPDYKNALHNRVNSAKVYFTPLLKKMTDDIYQKQVAIFEKEKKVKKYITELTELGAVIFKQIQQIDKACSLLNAAIDNKEFTREEVNSDALTHQRKNQLEAVQPKKERPKKKGKDTKPKVSTKEISYAFYKIGKSVAEIAKERNMAESTIEGHLAHCVAQGLIEVTDFVEIEKVTNIIAVSEKVETPSMGAIKHHLGDEYTYRDIRFALAHRDAKG